MSDLLSRTTARTLLGLSVLCLLFIAPSTSGALEPVTDASNECVHSGGQGLSCDNDADCAGHDYATRCLPPAAQGDKGTCQIPCEAVDVDGHVVADRGACSLGETCVEKKGLHYCQPTRFRVDLNLLDLCIVHFLDGLQPGFGSDPCSVERNLSALMDQTGDRVFDVFDVDLCVLAFLEQPGCDLGAGKCEAEDLVPCSGDEDCGHGLYCDPERHTCQRDCGTIASRDETLGALHRECSAPLRVCKTSRGRCQALDTDTLEKITCAVDNECPAGAYCFLGRCAPMCFRNLDCPDTSWYCAPNNRCRALPHPDADAEEPFDPLLYVIRFARDSLDLNEVQDVAETPVVVIDLHTRREVNENPSVGFGYRLELDYHLKQDLDCLKPFVDCADAAQRAEGETEAQCQNRQDDCIITPEEEWVDLEAPFGVVTAVGDPTLHVSLDHHAAGALSPGVYRATLRAFFDNGDSTAIPVTLTKVSPSGEYRAQLSMYKGGIENTLNSRRPFTFGMRLKVTKTSSRWYELLEAHNLDEDQDIVDLSRGYVVHGMLHGSSALAFTRGDAGSLAENEIPFVGLYSPQYGRMRLIGIIEIPADLCIAEGGPCSDAADTELQVRNRFGRTIRRQIELTGPFVTSVGRFHGIYREKVSGLAADFDVTLEGGFIMDMLSADDSELPLDEPLLPAGAKAVGFPTDAEVLAAVTDEIDRACGPSLQVAGKPTARAHFESKQAFEAYLAQAKRRGSASAASVFGRTTIFPKLMSFSQQVQDALLALGTDRSGQQRHLNVYDFLSSRVLACDKDEPAPAAICIKEQEVRCGLLLHQKALLLGWVNLAEVKYSPPGDDGPVEECPVGQEMDAGGQCVCPEGCECPPGEEKDDQGHCLKLQTGALDLFCVDTIPTEGCAQSGADQPALLALQEHNRFWRHLGEIHRFAGGRDRSDAFLVMYRHEINPFAQGAALSYKVDKLHAAVRAYDALQDMMVRPEAAKVLFSWPVRAFEQVGNDWMGIMQAAIEERMAAIAELVDLKRRVFAGTGDTDFLYAQHLMQQELLTQVYLMSLQQHWQKELFGWLGESGRLFERGQLVLSQLNPAKNAVGITPDRVFFENTDLELHNWEGYRAQLVGPDAMADSGLVAQARDTVLDAVEQLQGAMSDLDALEQSILDSQLTLAGNLDEICGDPNPGDPNAPTKDYCQFLMKQWDGYDEWLKIRDCKLKGSGVCPAGFHTACASYDNLTAEGETATVKVCQDTVDIFIAGTDSVSGGDPKDDPIANAPTCLLNRDEVTVNVNGVQRPCVGGAMGELLQEKASIDRERRIVVGSAETLIKQIMDALELLEASEVEEAKLKKGVDAKKTADSILLAVQALSNVIGGIIIGASDGADCVVIAGLAVGSDCVGHVMGEMIEAIVTLVAGTIDMGFEIARDRLEKGIDNLERAFDREQRIREVAADMRIDAQEIDGLIDEYNVLSQESFNLQAQIEDLKYQAQSAVDTSNTEIRFLADHLVGRETGNLLRGEALVSEASDRFLEIRDLLYRMTVAYIHHYNVSPMQSVQLLNQTLAVVTLDDVEDVVGLLDDQAQQQCGLEGFDCDAANNVHTLRYSVRENLFPFLMDKIGASGALLTAGEQFHNTVTRPPYLKRRIRGGMVTDQIELVLTVPITLKKDTGDVPVWLVDPLSCNHQLDGRDPNGGGGGRNGLLGTVAVNVLGKNLGTQSTLHYELVRGGTDYLRACQPESTIIEFGTEPVLSYPIRTQLVSYAPQNPKAQQDAPPVFFVKSQALSACINAEESGGQVHDPACWKFFARDRSLSALDWKMMIPLQVGEGATQNAWISGDGLKEEEKPLIEDIVVYFRYRSLPVWEE